MRATVRVPFYNDDYINRRIEAQSTSFEVLRGKISAIITDDEIEEYRNGNITMASKLSSAIQTVDGFQQQVSSMESQYNAATGEFNTLKSKVSQFEQTVDGFRQTVSSYEQQEIENAESLSNLSDGLNTLSGTVNGLSDNMSNYVLERDLVTKINQSSSQIDLSVVNTSTLYTKTDVDNKLKSYTATNKLVEYIEQHKSDLKLTDSNIIAKVTGSTAWGANAQKVSDLETLANHADTLAQSAQTLASVKITTYYSSSAPKGTTANPLKTGDLWFNSTTLALKRYDGSNWVAVDNKQIAAAVAAAQTAQSTADGKIRTFLQSEAPTGMKAGDVGDLWIDLDEGNKMWRWSGSKWVDVQDDAILAAASLADEAKRLANGKITTYYQSAQPSAPSVGDMWIDTTKVSGKQINTLKRWNGSSWVVVDNANISQLLNDVATIEAIADKKIQTFCQKDAPANNATNDLDKGDLWIDTDDGNKLYRWSGSDWVNVQDAGIALAQETATAAQALAATKVTTYHTTSAPTKTNYPNLKAGDLWFNKTAYKDPNLNITVTKNVLNRYDGTNWEVVEDSRLESALAAASNAADLADLKAQSFFQTSAPANNSTNNLDEGDLWIDTDDDNRLYIWDKSKLKWVTVDSKLDDLVKWKTEAQIELTQDSIRQTITQWSDGAKSIVNMINQDTSGTYIQSDKIQLKANSAIDLLISGKTATFYQDSFPARSYNSATGKYTVNVGDVCYRTDQNNRAYIYTGSGSSQGWKEADSDKVIKSNVITSINADTSGVQIKGSKIKLEANDSITLAVNDARSYAESQATSAKNAANTATDNKLKNYTKTAELKIGINGIQTLVSNANIDLTGTRDAAVTLAGTATDNKLKSYTKTTSLVSYINQQSDLIEFGVIKNNAAMTAKLNAGTSKAKVFQQTTAPVQSVTNGIRNINVGDIWYNPSTSANAMKICTAATDSSATWVDDTIINRINVSGESATISADKINIKASSELKLMVTGKNSVFTQSEKPSTRTYNSTTGTYDINKGDIWYDVANNYKMYVCTYVSGTTATWTPAVGDNVTKNTVIYSIANSSETAKISSNKITLTSGSELANKVNDGQSKAKVFYTSTKPTQSTSNGIANIKTGDFWVDTRNSNRGDMYVWSGSSWVPEKLIARINASSEDESVQIKASRVAITAATLGIDASLVNVKAEDIRLQAKKIAWKSTNSVMTSEGELTSTDAASSPSTTILKSGHLEFTKTGTAIGRIGTNNFTANANYKGLVFDLERTGSYMAWAADTDTSDTNYELKWLYAKTADNANGYKANTLNALVPLHTHGNFISTYLDSSHKGYMRSRFRTADGTFGLASVTMNIFGMIVVVKDGIITDVYKGANSDTWSYSNKVTYES